MYIGSPVTLLSLWTLVTVWVWTVVVAYKKFGLFLGRPLGNCASERAWGKLVVQLPPMGIVHFPCWMDPGFSWFSSFTSDTQICFPKATWMCITGAEVQASPWGGARHVPSELLEPRIREKLGELLHSVAQSRPFDLLVFRFWSIFGHAPKRLTFYSQVLWATECRQLLCFPAPARLIPRKRGRTGHTPKAPSREATRRKLGRASPVEDEEMQSLAASPLPG